MDRASGVAQWASVSKPNGQTRASSLPKSEAHSGSPSCTHFKHSSLLKLLFFLKLTISQVGTGQGPNGDRHTSDRPNRALQNGNSGLTVINFRTVFDAVNWKIVTQQASLKVGFCSPGNSALHPLQRSTTPGKGTLFCVSLNSSKM